MTAKDSHDELKEKFAPFSFDPSEFAAIGQRRMEEFGSVQTELIQKFQEASQKWLERLQDEAKLSADFGSRLMRASSMPEAMNVLQEWNRHRFEMIAQDGKRLLDDTQKLIETSARLASSWMARGTGVSA